jgi:hypothetical protein
MSPPHAIAATACAVPFAAALSPAAAHATRQRLTRARAAITPIRLALVASGVWESPHAVSQRDPFHTVCGLPYVGGGETPAIWDPYAPTTRAHLFEHLDPRGQCRACAALVAADDPASPVVIGVSDDDPNA